MKKWFRFVMSKLRYDSPLQTLINALKLAGISFYPYYVYEEYIDNDLPVTKLKATFRNLEIKPSGKKRHGAIS